MTELAIISPVLGPRQKPLKDFYSRKEAAAYLTANGYPIAPQTLANFASNENRLNGPAFERIGWGNVRYARVDLDEWAARKTVKIAARK